MQTQFGGNSATCSVSDFLKISAESLPRLEEYFLNSTRRLDAISERVSRGEKVDPASHDWMLSSVDFLVEAMAGEGNELGDELRSNLLQLLLAIANLNERIRRQGLLSD